MTYNQIKAHQRKQGFAEMQSLIDSGLAWQLEGAVGRLAMDLLSSGACMLPKTSHIDYYGNYIPSRDDLKEGSKGTFRNSQRFYERNAW